MKSLAALVILSALLLSTPTARADDPLVATAKAAEQRAQQERWHANQANQAASAAQATADAAYAEATAQAVQATQQAQATQTAQATQATATAAQATAQALATADALAVEATRAAINAEATTAAHYQQAVETAQAQAFQLTATQAAAWAELDRLEIQRGRALQPLYVAGPWLIAVATMTAAGALLWRATRAGDSDCHDEIIEGEYCVLLPERIEPRPCVLRPIPRWESRRPAGD